jgi:hypothetical protein
MLAFFAAALTGIVGAIFYATLPRRLALLERVTLLPEDMKAEKTALLSRLTLAATGTSDLVKTIAARILVPYARSTIGSIALLCSSRSLDDERSRLRKRIESILASRPAAAEKLAGVEDLVSIVVELRAAPIRRAITFALRAWLPLHIGSMAIALALLAVHIAQAVMR